MYPWESKELTEFKKIRNNLTKIWHHTELDVDTLSKTGLRQQLEFISDIVNDLVCDMDTEVDRLVKRDIESGKKYVCTHCQTDKVYVCDPCLTEMEKHI
jgi:hypothetical protein|tara:strand:- start:11411 stop:11707 length:297 start_codon:yes stop_codon:yes gene_type:complete